jgi:hypothetical protein
MINLEISLHILMLTSLGYLLWPHFPHYYHFLPIQPTIPIPYIVQSIKQILQNINQQVIDTKYIKNLGQLIKITLKLRWYLTQKIKPWNHQFQNWHMSL